LHNASQRRRDAPFGTDAPACADAKGEPAPARSRGRFAASQRGASSIVFG